MTRLAPPLKASVMDHALSAVLGEVPETRALVVYPEPLVETAQAIGAALARRGIEAEIRLTPELSFQAEDRTAAASGWVPPPAPDQPDLLVLYGGQPWRDPFPDDYRVGIEAMTHREAQLARGARILFIEWPYGARKDAEVDLTPEQVATIF